MKTEISDKLVSLLKDGADVHRCAAAQALGNFNLPNVTEALVAALLDDDPDVRVDAANALLQINDPATAQKLMDNLLGDPDADVKKAAIKALVAMKFDPVVPYLRALVISRAEDKIAWDEDEFFNSGWDDWVDVQMLALEGLAVFAHVDAVPEIVTAMADPENQDLTEAGLRALCNMGPDGAMAVIELYGQGDDRMCRRIVRAVGESGNPDLAALRAGLIGDKNAEIRALAILNLDPSDENLIPLFGDDDAAVRAAVVKHAGAQNPTLLWDMIRDQSDAVRAEVFKVISAKPEIFDDKDLIDAVQKAIKGEPKAAKEAAMAVIALKGPKAVKGLTHVIGNADIPRDFRVGVIEAFERAGTLGVPALMEAAGDEDRELRLSSMTSLAQIAANDPEWPNVASDALLSALKGELVLPPEEEEVEPEIVEEAPEPSAAELEEIYEEIDADLPLKKQPVKPQSTLDAIMANEPAEPVAEPEEIILSEQDQAALERTKVHKFAKRKVSWETAAAPHLDVQRFAARLLGSIVKPDVTAALVEAMNADIDEEARQAVLFSLAKHGETTNTLSSDILENLKGFFGDEDSQTRVLAVRVLGKISDDYVTEKLLELLSHDDPLVRVEAVQAIAQRNEVSDPIIGALNDSYMGVGIAAARALARQYGDTAVDALVVFASENDGTYRRDIGKLLGQYAPVAGYKRLLKMLGDETQKTRWLVAIDALSELVQTVENEPALQNVA